jgi:excisionase family DNA binding protein
VAGVKFLAFGFVGRDIRMADVCKPLQPSINTAFEAEPPSSRVQPDASKWKLLAVSLLYTERTVGDYGERFLTVRRAAQLLGVSAAVVYAWCAKGMLRHARVGSTIRIAWADLEEFLKEHSKGRVSRRAQAFPLLPPHTVESATDPARPRDESDVSPENEATREPGREQR